MRRGVRIGLLAAGALLALFAAVGVAYVLDSHAHRGRVMRHVTLAGVDVDGLQGHELDAAVGRVVKRYESARVVVKAKGGGFTTTTKRLGVSVDRRATVRAALHVGRSGSPLGRAVGWFMGAVRPRRAPVRIRVDAPALYSEVGVKDRARTPAVEPTIKVDKGRLVAVAGRAGKGIDPAAVAAALPDAAARGLPLRVSVERGRVPPRFSLNDARDLLEKARSTVTRSLDVVAGEDRATLTATTLRSWLTAKPGATALELRVDGTRAVDGLQSILDKAGEPPVETTFTVGGDGVRLVPGSPGTACCAAAAADLIENAVLHDGRGPVELPLRRVDPKRTVEDAQELGIKQLVSTFTTHHKAGQPRVHNIHRIADLVRGTIIEPGETFSVNGFVGQRTQAKGFVVDHVIEEGRFSEAVGGGISQFATTTFNAAFFAGLEMVEYQSHSIYISRYPYGREATLSFPHPDLRIRNPSPYGILLWTSYTDTSLTVSMYSTKWVDVKQSNQTKETRGQSCTRVRTERTIRFLSDDHTKVDHVSALYRGAEGLDCDKPLSASTTTTSSTTTTVPRSTTTSAGPSPSSSTTMKP